MREQAGRLYPTRPAASRFAKIALIPGAAEMCAHMPCQHCCLQAVRQARRLGDRPVQHPGGLESRVSADSLLTTRVPAADS